MKIVTLFGTRPEIIRLSQIAKYLDRFCDQTLVHTGQNYDPALSDTFFTDLDLRQPDIHFGIQADDFAEQTALILTRSHEVLREIKPDRVLILGDTNSGLAAIVASRLGIPVYHLEAGNRCYDDRVPEEINRRIIDHTSTVLMPYTHRSKDNLVREGILRERIFVVGNPIHEVLAAHADEIASANAFERLEVEPGGYFLCTLHRSENVDVPERLDSILTGLALVADTFATKLLVSLHPRTADRIARSGVEVASKRVVMLDPLPFFDFVALEKNARCLLSDSGTVQEECCLFNVPAVTLRDVTERPETIECGSNILTGPEPEKIRAAVEQVIGTTTDWQAPPEYLVENVSAAVGKILLGHREAVHRYGHV